jgi:spoIIIJ-associated protein
MNDAEIKKLIETILAAMSIACDAIDVEVDPVTSNKVFIIRTLDSGLLIGERGEHYYALTHLVKRIAEKGAQEGHQEFFIDINDYRSSLAEKLKTKAKILADRARDMRSNVEMEPMSSYERLVVHGALTGLPNIKTESEGEGKNRHIIIRYVEEAV